MSFSVLHMYIHMAISGEITGQSTVVLQPQASTYGLEDPLFTE